MAETVDVAVSSLVYAAGGAAIFSGRDPDGRRVRVVAGTQALPRPPVVGEIWTVDGDYREHPKYGRQLHATRASYTPPRGRLIVGYLASHPDFAGLGETKAKALYEAFGTRLMPLLDSGDVNALQTILSGPMATRLIAVWADHRGEAAVVAFLDAHGFDARLAARLRRVWGGQSLQMLETNPYYMLAFAPWPATDAAARKLGVALHDERRLVGAVEAALYTRLHDAHTLTSAAMLRERVAKLLGAAGGQAGQAVELALMEGAIVGDDSRGYQPVGAAALEARIAERLAAMLAGETPTQLSLLATDFGSDWLAEAISEAEAAQGFKLNALQRDAVAMAAMKPFSVLAGGAGVGKTTVLRVVIDIAKRLNRPVVQMALAGRAAKRMAEATGHEALTIARFLHQAKDGQEVPPDTLVIIDEASMLDLPTAFRILKHLPDGARLLLVGDPAQLPPIGFGLVFHRLVESAAVPRVELTEVHRQAAETGIPAIAAAIRAHQVPAIGEYTGRRPGVSFIECGLDEVVDRLDRLADDWAGHDWQVLGAVKAGSAGIDGVNAYFHGLCDDDDLAGFRPGEPVIHLINDYDRGLMNGTLGRITAVSNGEEPGLHVDFEGGQHFLPAAEVTERLELAYAISVHKAQGSQFRYVAFMVAPSRVLDQALVYTALTRGIEQVVFVGDREAFEQAVRSPAAAHLREVGFRSLAWRDSAK